MDDIKSLGEELASAVMEGWLRESTLADTRDLFSVGENQEGFDNELFMLILFVNVLAVKEAFADATDFAELLIEGFHNRLLISLNGVKDSPYGVVLSGGTLSAHYEVYSKLAEKGLDYFVRQAPYKLIEFADSYLHTSNRTSTIDEYAEKWGMTIMAMQVWLGQYLILTLDNSKNFRSRLKP